MDVIAPVEFDLFSLDSNVADLELNINKDTKVTGQQYDRLKIFCIAKGLDEDTILKMTREGVIDYFLARFFTFFLFI